MVLHQKLKSVRNIHRGIYLDKASARLYVFNVSGEWMWALIVGEALGVLFAILFDTI